MFYSFRQNNSGGVFIHPAICVIVEAENYSEANEIAQDHGVYFNGCDEGSDCECCGDRWYAQWSYDSGMDEPGIYDSGELDESPWAVEREDLPSYLIIYKDGRQVTG